MSGFNKLFLLGNLTRDPDLRQFASGQSVCKLNLATSRNIKSKNGETPSQEVCFIEIDVWGAQADSCKKILEKGSSVFVEGRLKWDSWTDKTGAKRSKHSVVADRVIFMRSANSTASQENRLMAELDGEALFDKGEISLESEDAFKDDLPF